MVLVVDIGNTRTKAAVFQQRTFLAKYVFDKSMLDHEIINILKDYPSIINIVVSSVSNFDCSAFPAIFQQYSVDLITSKNHFPFKNLYATPDTLGIDRMILSAGAVLSFPNKNRLVIDAGTCVTFDYIDDANNYLGGGISPGLRLRYKSLHSYTAKLPLLETKFPQDRVGNSTSEAIHSGVVYGLIHEIDGIIDAFKVENSNFIIILTGGDADFLANRLKNTIFANSNFLLESLNLLHIYNSKND